MLGDGTTTARHSPVEVMDGVAQVSFGGGCAAIMPDGSLWMWGSNYYGQLGDGTTEDRHSPVKVMDGVAQVSLGGGRSAALKEDGSLWTWGANYYGQLGDGTTTDRHSPVKVMDGVAQVSLGYHHTAALKEDGSLWMWGYNYYGQIDKGGIVGRNSPVKVMDGVAQVSLGYSHTAALKEDGSLWMWGSNECGQLGYTPPLGYNWQPACIFRNGKWLSEAEFGDPIDTSDVLGEFTTIGYEDRPRTFSGEEEGFRYKDSYFYGSATEYNHSLATMSLCMAFSTYGLKSSDSDDPYESYDANVEELMRKCGFADEERYSQYHFNEVPTETSIACAIGSKTIDVDGEDVTLIAVAVRGGGYEDEWASNVDVGGFGDHVGFDKSAEKVKDCVIDYIQWNHIAGDVKIWITGYSRAAAVATQAAAKLDDMSGYAYTDDSGYKQVEFDKNSIYAYGFATPAGACKASDPHSEQYSNIWSVIEYNDPVPLVAPEGWGFDRYGTTRILPYRESNDAKKYKKYYDRMRERLDAGHGYNIEGFTNYAALQFGAGGVIASAPNPFNHDTQGTFLRKVVRAVAGVMGDRVKYCREYQSEVQATVERFMGGEDKSHDFSDILRGLVIEFVAKLYLFPVLHPHLSATLAKNYSTLAEVHADQDYYLGWMQLMDENYPDSLPLVWGDPSYRVFKGNCPVDLYVYDADGEVVASIVDEVPSAGGDQPVIVGVDENGQKVAYLPNGGGYRVEVVAREDCEVSCGVEEVSAVSGAPVRVTNFEATPLASGASMQAEVPAVPGDEAEGAADEGSSAQYAMAAGGGEVAVESDIRGADAIAERTFDVTVSYDEAQGQVYGGGSFVEGSFARLEGVDGEGYYFDGFYVDGTKLEGAGDGDENAARLKVTGDVNVEARFVEKTAVPVPSAASGLVYDGSSQVGVAEGEGYIVEGGEATEAGSHIATATLDRRYKWDDGTCGALEVSWAIAPAKVTALALSKTSYTYTSKVQKPGVGSVKAGSLSLAASDYTVKYSNASSKAAGTYKVTVTGKGNFAGSKTASYTIEPAAVTALALSKTSLTYNGKVQKPGVKSAKAGTLSLKSSDYTVKYSNSSSKAAGTYKVTVTGKGNFKGSKTATYKIAKAANTATAAKASVKKSFKVAKLKKAKTVALPKVTTSFGTAKWKVAKKDRKKVLSLKGGKVKVKKGAKAGKYTIKLKATVAGTANYKAATTKVVTVKVTVK